MKTIKDLDFSSNILLQEFLRAGDLSEAGLKRAYRKLCFIVHPDTSDTKNDDFLLLKKNYQDILESFPEISRQLKSIREKNIHYTFSDLRRDLYLAIREYVGLGLHSPRMRLREALKERNDKVIGSLLALAKRYDPALHEALELFNGITVHSFESQRIERMHKKLKQKLLTGIANACSYVCYQHIQSIRKIALSYFHDIKFLPIPENDFGKSIWMLSDWFYRDLSEND